MNQIDIAEISEFEVFASLSEEVIQQLLPFLKQISFAPGALILKRGTGNLNLYFLKSGTISINLEGEKITTISKKGEVFGEISAFIGVPVSANILSETDVEVIELSVGDLDQVFNENNIGQHRALSRVFINILSRRLLQTNEKAKSNEVNTRSLLESQEKIKLLTQNINEIALEKFNEFSKPIDALYSQIKALDSNLLTPLLNRLDLEDSQELYARELKHVLSEIKSIFSGVVSRETRRTRAIIRKRVLFIDTDRRRQTLIKLAVAGLNVDLIQAFSEEEGRSELSGDEFDLVFCDVGLSEGLKVEISECKMGSVVITSTGLIEKNLEKLKSRGFLANLMTLAEEDRNFTIANSRSNIQKLLNKDIFGIEKYLSYGTRVYEVKLSDSTMRDQINVQVQEFFKKMGIRAATLTRVQSALEEMMMNAVYAAPVDEKGKSLFNHLSRTTIVNLSEIESAKVRYGCDGSIIIVSVEDPFGSLKKEILMNYLESIFSGQAGALNTGKGGAGRGLHMMIQAADLTIFNVNSGVKTEVISMFSVDAALNRREIIPTFQFYFA